jgi:hypothetical protein
LLDVSGRLLPAVVTGWWARTPHPVDLGPVVVDDPPTADAGGMWVIDGTMRWARLRRDVPVQLVLWPYLTDRWTVAVLEPRRPVTPSRAWYRCGHAVLDRTVDAFQRT